MLSAIYCYAGYAALDTTDVSMLAPSDQNVATFGGE